jgi:hypothetical protein
MMNSKTTLGIVTYFLSIFVLAVPAKAALDLNTWTENLMADDVAGGGFVINSATQATTISGGLTRAVLFSGTNDRKFML